MQAFEVIHFINEIERENNSLKKELERLKENAVNAEKFYAVAVSVEMVALFHNVHPDTIRKYINLGLIEKHPKSTDAKYLIRASDALKLNISEIKKQALYKRINK